MNTSETQGACSECQRFYERDELVWLRVGHAICAGCLRRALGLLEPEKPWHERVRELLLSIPKEPYGFFGDALAEAEVCLHCGTDNRGRRMPCQCWNDD